MNGVELLRIVDAIHRDKNIDKEIVFDGIEQAILSAARKHYGEELEIVVEINREDGEVTVNVEAKELDSDELGDLLGRIAAQTAKQVMIQKIREAERDALYDEFTALRGQIVTGAVTRIDGGTVTVNLGKVEGLLPRGEQIPGDSHRVGERVRAVVMDVRKSGTRVKIILSRTHPEMVRRLFELEIPEVAENVIDVRSLAREAGYRSKVAVSCFDSKIDCVGACVGVRGSRIKSVVEELAGERIDIVRWNDSLQVLVPNALQPAEVEDVILCPMLGKVIVLVRDDQLSLAIGKKGQNVRLASKLVGWDIHVMTQERLDEQLDVSVAAFAAVPEVTGELAESLVAQGFFTFDDLSVIEPDQLAELGGLTTEQCDVIVAHADEESARAEVRERREREERQRLARIEAETRALQGPESAAEEPAASAAAPSNGAPPSEGSAPAAAEETSAETAAEETAAEETAAEETAAEETAAEETAAEETAAEETAAEETSEETADAPAPAAETSEVEVATAATDEADQAVTLDEPDETNESDETVIATTAQLQDASGEQPSAEESAQTTDDGQSEDEQSEVEAAKASTAEDSTQAG